jgi:hypothetical protein
MRETRAIVMDFKMAAGLVAGAVGLVGALAAVLIVVLGHPHAGAVTPYPTPRHTPALSTQIHMNTGTIICHRHC